MPIPERKKVNKSRLFVAYMLSSRFQKKLRVWEESSSFLPVRWTSPDNLHMTIIPPWYEDATNNIMALLKKPVPVSPFSLRFTDIRPGPTPYQPRLMWTTAQEAPELTQLRSYLQQLIHAPAEKHSFVPHVTLGKLFIPLHTPTVLPSFKSTFSRVEYISHIHLVQSFLSRSGAIYKILLTIHIG